MLNNEGKSALSRRTFVAKVAAGTAGAAVAWAAGIGRAKAMSAREESAIGSAKGESALGLTPNVPQAEPHAPQAEPQAITEASPPQSAPPPPPWELLRPLALGSVVAHGWRVAALDGAVDGSCVLTLENERGRTHRVHLCRNGGHPQGLVYTERFDLVLMNGGQGDLPTEEGLARAVAEVAHVVAANEGDRHLESLVTELLPQAERVQMFAAAAKLR